VDDVTLAGMTDSLLGRDRPAQSKPVSPGADRTNVKIDVFNWPERLPSAWSVVTMTLRSDV
jgi:hypothetical protein